MSVRPIKSKKRKKLYCKKPVSHCSSNTIIRALDNAALDDKKPELKSMLLHRTDSCAFTKAEIDRGNVLSQFTDTKHQALIKQSVGYIRQSEQYVLKVDVRSRKNGQVEEFERL